MARSFTLSGRRVGILSSLAGRHAVHESAISEGEGAEWALSHPGLGHVVGEIDRRCNWTISNAIADSIRKIAICSIRADGHT